MLLTWQLVIYSPTLMVPCSFSARYETHVILNNITIFNKYHNQITNSGSFIIRSWQYHIFWHFIHYQPDQINLPIRYQKPLPHVMKRIIGIGSNIKFPSVKYLNSCKLGSHYRGYNFYYSCSTAEHLTTRIHALTSPNNTTII